MAEKEPEIIYILLRRSCSCSYLYNIHGSKYDFNSKNAFSVGKEQLAPAAQMLDSAIPGCKENHFYSLPFGRAETSIY